MTVDDDAALARELARQERESYLEYGDAFDLNDESDDGNFSDGEYGGPKKRKRAPASAHRKPSKPRSVPATAESMPEARTPRTTKPPQRWTDDEHGRFVEGLELYGREWDRVAAHIGTGRDKNAVKSHAQKHFIKLHLKGESLPAKVKESGEGYTLSGKPLDPNSAALGAYMKTGKGREGAAVDEETAAPIPRADDEPKAKRRRPAAKREATPVSETDELVCSGRTEYASSRLRSLPQQSEYLVLDDDGSNPWMMVQCHRYSGAPGSSGRGSQPFVVRVRPSVLLVADFHAHMASTEIIGFLAGQWNATSKELSIEEAFPCRAVQTDGDANTSVEMDPAAEVELRDEIRRRDLAVVGWYHSHPTFKPIPSNRDIENQSNYQVLMRDASGQEPFVGLVVGPFDKQMPTEASVMNWFYVNRKGVVEKNVPMVLDVEIDVADSAYDAAFQKMDALIDTYASFETRVPDFSAVWRPAEGRQEPGGLVQPAPEEEAHAAGVTLREKLRASLKSRLSACAVDVLSAHETRIDGLIDNLGRKWQH